MLWVEGRLGAIERACMRSVLHQGHQLVLWHYFPLEGVPDGIELRDGNEIVPRERLFRHVPTGGWALFSNLFRYTLLKRDLGIWLDCDAYLVRPVPKGDGYIFGADIRGTIQSGVLGLPANLPLLDELIAYFDARRIPPWLPWRWQLRFYGQRIFRGRFRIETMPWGNLGPYGLTALLRKHGLAKKRCRLPPSTPGLGRRLGSSGSRKKGPWPALRRKRSLSICTTS